MNDNTTNREMLKELLTDMKWQIKEVEKIRTQLDEIYTHQREIKNIAKLEEDVRVIQADVREIKIVKDTIEKATKGISTSVMFGIVTAAIALSVIVTIATFFFTGNL